MKLTLTHRREILTSLTRSMIEKRQILDQKVIDRIQEVFRQHIRKDALNFIMEYPDLINRRSYQIRNSVEFSLLPVGFAAQIPHIDIGSPIPGVYTNDLSRGVFNLFIVLPDVYTLIKYGLITPEIAIVGKDIKSSVLYQDEQSANDVISLCNEHTRFLIECREAIVKTGDVLNSFHTDTELFEIFPEFRQILEKSNGRITAVAPKPPKPVVDRKSLINTLSSLKVLPGQDSQKPQGD